MFIIIVNDCWTYVRSVVRWSLTHSLVRSLYIIHYCSSHRRRTRAISTQISSIPNLFFLCRYHRQVHTYHLYETYSFQAGTTPHLMLIGQGYVFTCCVFIIDLLSSLTVEWCTQFTPYPIRGAQQLTGDEGLYLPKSKLLYL